MENFDLSVVDTPDEGELVIKHPKTLEPIGWIRTFYGPGHGVTRIRALFGDLAELLL